jgi:hypothetical protein
MRQLVTFASAKSCRLRFGFVKFIVLDQDERGQIVLVKVYLAAARAMKEAAK